MGGCVAAMLYSTAEAHFTTTLASHDQPDVHTLHIQFFRPCIPANSTIKVMDRKIGKGSCFIQLDLSQDGEIKCTALASSINFDVAVGPTAKSGVKLLPPPRPNPDFAKVEVFQPDENWISSKSDGELFPFVRRMSFLYPIDGHKTDGIVDYWTVFDRPEKMDGAHLALVSDLAPSMSDTLLRNGGLFDAHRIHKIKKEAAEKAPGQPAILKATLKEAAQSLLWETTVTMDLQFKRRMADEEMMWTFSRASTRMLEGGRMDVDIEICDREMVPICLARQVMIVLDASRRWKKGGKSKTANL